MLLISHSLISFIRSDDFSRNDDRRSVRSNPSVGRSEGIAPSPQILRDRSPDTFFTEDQMRRSKRYEDELMSSGMMRRHPGEMDPRMMRRPDIGPEDFMEPKRRRYMDDPLMPTMHMRSGLRGVFQTLCIRNLSFLIIFIVENHSSCLTCS